MWGKLIGLVLSLFDKLAEIIGNERLMDAGAAKAELEGRKNVDNSETVADNARRNAELVPVSEDPNNRSSRGKSGELPKPPADKL